MQRALVVLVLLAMAGAIVHLEFAVTSIPSNTYASGLNDLQVKIDGLRGEARAAQEQLRTLERDVAAAMARAGNAAGDSYALKREVERQLESLKRRTEDVEASVLAVKRAR